MSGVKGVEALSKRAAENVTGVDHWAPLVAALSNPWSRTNPDGMVILGLAENTLMHGELEEHIKKNFDIHREEHFSYGIGPQGSLRLRTALADFFNDKFHPRQDTKPQEFLPTAGCTALIDHLTWCLCDIGEGILFPQPLYAGFTNDVPTRSRGLLIPVPFTRDDGSLDLDDVFDAEANAYCFERAYRKMQQLGIKVKGVMITNPHNPLGKCYPVDTIKAIAAFCAKHDLHYLSDEIYAMSVFKNPAYPDATPFTSVRSTDMSNIIDPEMVHVLYGMSKDFCANGLRLGVLHSRSAALRSAMTSITTFAWEAYIVQDIWSRILTDRPFLDRFLATNQALLSTHYGIITSFLRAHDIPYYAGGNAGFFVWVDLRAWLLGSSGGAPLSPADARALRADGPDADAHRAREKALRERWTAKGVMIARGTGSMTEELGWFRIVFTAEEEALRLGLRRFVDGLRELREEGVL